MKAEIRILGSFRMLTFTLGVLKMTGCFVSTVVLTKAIHLSLAAQEWEYEQQKT